MVMEFTKAKKDCLIANLKSSYTNAAAPVTVIKRGTEI